MTAREAIVEFLEEALANDVTDPETLALGIVDLLSNRGFVIIQGI